MSESKGNEGNCIKSSEAYTSNNKDNCKDTSGGAVLNFRHASQEKKSKQRKLPMKEERDVL